LGITSLPPRAIRAGFPRLSERRKVAFEPAAGQRKYNKNRQEEALFRQESRQNKGSLCCKSLHISLFFDGTNNNEPNDTASTPPHPSNVAKLYHACAPDDRKANERGFYAFYIPGVGTPFPRIGTYDYYSSGLQFAVGGEDRINWGWCSYVMP
jgi:hypothetical protein